MGKKNLLWVYQFYKKNIKKHLSFMFSKKDIDICSPHISKTNPKLHHSIYPQGWQDMNSGEKYQLLAENFKQLNLIMK